MEFNTNEQTVLNALIKEAKDCTGGEFGYMPDVDRCGFSKHQFAGYIGDLRKKGVFSHLDISKDEIYSGQYIIIPELQFTNTQ